MTDRNRDELEAALRAEVLGSDPDHNLDIRIATFIEERERPLRVAAQRAWQNLYAVKLLVETGDEKVDWKIVGQNCRQAADLLEAALNPTETSEQ